MASNEAMGLFAFLVPDGLNDLPAGWFKHDVFVDMDTDNLCWEHGHRFEAPAMGASASRGPLGHISRRPDAGDHGGTLEVTHPIAGGRDGRSDSVQSKLALLLFHGHPS